MGNSLVEYLRLVVERWWAVVPGGAFGVVAVVGAFGPQVGLPPWAWALVAMGALVFAQFLAFHAVRIQRDTSALPSQTTYNVTGDLHQHFYGRPPTESTTTGAEAIRVEQSVDKRQDQLPLGDQEASS